MNGFTNPALVTTTDMSVLFPSRDLLC